ncbi:hypothetical protein H2201_000882, partial [Coniosporium apollinis]
LGLGVCGQHGFTHTPEAIGTWGTEYSAGTSVDDGAIQLKGLFQLAEEAQVQDLR